MNSMKTQIISWLFLLVFALPLCSQEQVVVSQESVFWTVNARKVIADVNPDMYGIFFEDINFGADGGLYAEMVKNRSFEFPQSLMGWKSFGNVKLEGYSVQYQSYRQRYCCHRDHE